MPAANIGIALNSAIRNAYTEKLKSLISILKNRNIDINAVQTLGLQRHPLEIARVFTPISNKIRVLTLLAEAGATLTMAELNKALNAAVIAGDYDLTQWLIEHGQKNNILNPNALASIKATAEEYGQLSGFEKKPSYSRIKYLLDNALKQLKEPAQS